MIYVYLIIGLFVLGAGGGIVYKYNSAIEDAAEAQTKLKDSEANAANWMAVAEDHANEITSLNRAAKQRETSRARIEKERNDAHAEIEKLRRTDKKAADWLDTPLPDAIVARLRFGPGTEGTAPAKAGDPRTVRPADPAAGVHRGDKR